MDALQAEVERLRVAIDAVVPADDFPSASQAGRLRFWSRVTSTERPEWANRAIGVLDLLDRRSGGRFAKGTDPATSVADPCGRVWGHPNLRVIDGSLHVTNGGVNPVLTIFANAFRIMHTWVGSGRDYL